VAEFIGNNHEQHGEDPGGEHPGSPGSHASTRMDLWNNIIGRQCAFGGGSCQDCCLRSIEEGKIVIDRNKFNKPGTPTPPSSGGAAPKPPDTGGGGTPTTPTGPAPQGGPEVKPGSPKGGSRIRSSWRDAFTRWITGLTSPLGGR
jgi:hypothetical protein